MKRVLAVAPFALMLALVACFACVGALQAQSFYGSVIGTITDASGAVVPAATVTVTNLGTNEKHSVKSDASGTYSLVNLIPATYDVEIQAPNFKRLLRSAVEVQVGVAARIDASLQVGAVTETVQVTSAAPLLDTESSQMSQQVEGTTVQQMPLNGRNSMNLISLTAGVVPQGGTSGAATVNEPSGVTGKGGWGNYQIGGGIANHNAVYVDGVPSNILGNGIAYIPTQDFVQEFNVASNSVTADFGRYEGGVVNMTSRSGTNAWHGSVYEYFRNSALNANDWFNKANQLASGQPNTPTKYNQNQYGANIGGPIRKNKAFFTFTWEPLSIRLATPSPTYVPTTAMKKGLIPFQYNANGTVIPVSDPLGNCVPVKNTTAGYWDLSSCTFNAAAQQFLKFYPDSNTGSSTYYYRAVVVGDDSFQYNVRGDYNLSAKQRLFARYSYWKVPDMNFNEFPEAQYNAANWASIFSTKLAEIGDTYTLNPTTILDVRVSWLLMWFANANTTTNANQSLFFPSASFVSQEQVRLLPTFTLNKQRNFYTGWSGNNANSNYSTNDTISANVIKILGRHSLKAGTELRLMNRESTGNANSGTFNYTGNYTGDEWADLLLGYAHDGSISITAPTTSYNKYQAYYLTDTWRTLPKLTVNLGLRYDAPGSIAEARDRGTVLLPHTVDPYTGVTGTLGLLNSSLYDGRTIQRPNHLGFAPRVGVAYSLDPQTVIHAGYGISFLPPDIDTPGGFPYSSVVNTATTSFTNSNPLTPGNVSNGTFTLMNNPFPAGLTPAYGRSNPAFMTKYLFTAVAGPYPYGKAQYEQQWNLAIARQLIGDWKLEVGYAGAKGTHIPSIGGGLDQLGRQYWSTGNALTANNVTLTTPIGGYSKKVTLGQSLRPYPFYTNFTDQAAQWSSTNWNSLQIKSEKRFHSGGIVMGSYTWSKMLSDTDTPNSYLELNGYGAIQDMEDHRAEHSLSTYNVPVRAVVSYVLPLPIGNGQKYLSGAHGTADRLVSGWAVNGISTFQSGYALGLEEAAKNNLTNNFGAGTLRPDYNAGAPGCNSTKNLPGAVRQRLNGWFNTACFQAPGTAINNVGWELGNEPRVDGAIHSQGVDNWDFAAQKTTRIAERVSFEFRSEFFNVFNRTTFAPPVVTRGSSNFGKVIQTNPSYKNRFVQFSGRISF